jgi:glycosyltransferase involved in cell wall biosynthesis
MKTLDIVTSAHNEEGNIKELYDDLKKTLDFETDYQWKLIITDNGSTDRTWDEIFELCAKYPNIEGLKLSKDFGFEGAIKAGLDLSDADAIVIMTSDLQDSPTEIPKFLREFENGFDNVYQIVSSRPDSTLLRKINSGVFYWLAYTLSDGQIPKNVSEFRLISKRLNEAMKSLPERNRFLRGIVSWTGYRSKGIPFSRQPRRHGKSKAISKHVFKLGVKGILVNSYSPLNMVAVLGAIMSGLSFLLTAVFSSIWLTSGTPFAGFGILVGINLLGFGLVMLALGVMSQYLALVYEEQKSRPSYLIMDRAGKSISNP